MAFWNFGKRSQEVEVTTEPILLGVDLGYGQIKTVGERGRMKFLSAVGTPVSNFGRNTAITNERELLDSLALTLEGQTYYVGHNAVVNTRNGRLSLRQNKTNDDHNRVKFLTGLALHTDEDQTEATFEVVTGLPVLEFKNQRDALAEMMLNGGRPFEFDMHYGNKTVPKRLRVDYVKVVSQGEGAFYDLILDRKGDLIERNVGLVNGLVMVVDVGYRTTDIVTMENGRYVETLSDQLNKGVNQIHQEILRLIMERYGIKKELKDLDAYVRTGTLYHNTREYDINQIITAAAVPFAEDIVESLHTVSNDQLGGVNRVVFTGGGAELIHPYVIPMLRDIVETLMLDDSEFCNANGYYKYGLLLKKTQGAD